MTELQARVAALTTEGVELISKLSDRDLATWIKHHGRLLGAAQMEVARRKENA